MDKNRLQIHGIGLSESESTSESEDMSEQVTNTALVSTDRKINDSIVESQSAQEKVVASEDNKGAKNVEIREIFQPPLAENVHQNSVDKIIPTPTLKEDASPVSISKALPSLPATVDASSSPHKESILKSPQLSEEQKSKGEPHQQSKLNGRISELLARLEEITEDSDQTQEVPKHPDEKIAMPPRNELEESGEENSQQFTLSDSPIKELSPLAKRKESKKQGKPEEDDKSDNNPPEPPVISYGSNPSEKEEVEEAKKQPSKVPSGKQASIKAYVEKAMPHTKFQTKYYQTVIEICKFFNDKYTFQEVLLAIHLSAGNVSDAIVRIAKGDVSRDFKEFLSSDLGKASPDQKRIYFS